MPNAESTPLHGMCSTVGLETTKKTRKTTFQCGEVRLPLGIICALWAESGRSQEPRSLLVDSGMDGMAISPFSPKGNRRSPPATPSCVTAVDTGRRRGQIHGKLLIVDVSMT
ncbi:hypothetical protein RUM43_015111 [Polyplax serrata]|uniref:Uncharacterized protein n=1 Tax=Polyplax serrata TaxID=468196 RepID=A0AAN8PFL3_POLSC